jgi:hypothetical protein
MADRQLLWRILKDTTMRKISTILIYIVLFVNIGKSQESLILNQKDFVFKVEFYPSFIAPCRIILKKNGESKTLSIDYLYSSKQFKIKNQNDLIIENSDSLLLDKWNHPFYGDTIFVKHIENVIVSENGFKNFNDCLSLIDLTKQKSLIKEGILDGITIYLRFKTDSIDNHFSLRCPDPVDTSEFKIIKTWFDLIESSFKTELANNYIEHLKGYFNFGLLVKRISDNPVEYRFYSHLSSNEADEFYKLMESLPNDKPVIFDFSNFEGMGTMFYDDFEELIENNSHVYWIVNDYSIKQVKEIGVKSNRIFKDRQTLLKKIKNVP